VPGRQKHDRIDAETIARLYASGVLKSGTLIVPALEDLKAIFRAAARLEVDRTALKNRVKKTLDRAGIRPAGLNMNAEWARAFLYYVTDCPGTVGDNVIKLVNVNNRAIQKEFTSKHWFNVRSWYRY